MNKKLNSIIVVALLCLTMSINASFAQQIEKQIAFSVNLLSPNTSAARNQWSLLMEQQLPKIGIGVSFHESTGWGNIAPRTWSYPLLDYDYIPTYSEGGFDILFVGWSWDLDWDPTGLYDLASFVPMGSNFYQYSNPTYDEILDEYLTAIDPVERTNYAYQLQQILYEDLPAICLVYPRSLFGFKESVNGIDGLLIASGAPRTENWDDPDDHVIKYGIPADLREPNFFVQESFYDGQWMASVYGALFLRGKDHHDYEPVIAKNATISEIIDEKINITTFLDPNAKFSDGSIILPEDVKYSYELHLTPAVGSRLYGYLNSWFDSNDSIEIIDNVPGGEMIFKLSGVYNFALSLLSFPIVDRSEIEPLIATFGYDIFNDVPGTGNAQWSLVKSCGPFMLDSYDAVNSIVKMIPNPYWKDLTAANGDPKLNEWYLVFVAGKDNAVAELIANNIDIMDAQYYPVLADFEGVAGIEGVIIKDPTHQEMSINLLHPVFGTGDLTPLGTVEAAKNIRKAISHAVPRQTIVDEILEGLGAPGVTATPDSVVGFDDTLDPYAYDMDLSIEYMEEAGYTIELEVPEETGIAGLVFISFLGLAVIEAMRKLRSFKKT